MNTETVEPNPLGDISKKTSLKTNAIKRALYPSIYPL